MGVSYRSILTAGVTAVTATALVAAPVITPTAAPAQAPATVSIPVQNTAAVSPLALDLSLGEASAIQRATPPPAMPRATAAAPTAARASNPGSTPNPGNIISNAYDFVEPWVQWGVDLATWATGWVPYVGMLAGQIPILYDFGEALVRSVVYNLSGLVFGEIPFTQGLQNLGRDAGIAVNNLVQDEINWVTGWLPPIFPLPSLVTSRSLATTATSPLESIQTAVKGVQETFTTMGARANDPLDPKTDDEVTTPDELDADEIAKKDAIDQQDPKDKQDLKDEKVLEQPKVVVTAAIDGNLSDDIKVPETAAVVTAGDQTEPVTGETPKDTKVEKPARTTPSLRNLFTAKDPGKREGIAKPLRLRNRAAAKTTGDAPETNGAAEAEKAAPTQARRTEAPSFRKAVDQARENGKQIRDSVKQRFSGKRDNNATSNTSNETN